jgi:hypothetical protein
MSLKTRIKSLLTGRPHFPGLKSEHRIKLAFTFGGVDYFEMENPDDLLTGRALAAVNFYTELSMKCTREFLIAHTKAVHGIVRNPKVIDIPQLDKLNTQLMERLEMILDTETPYKVASVIYFDESEDPYSFDYQYAFKKIEKWKKGGLESFFLTTPASKLIPPSLLSEEVLKTFMKVTQEIDREHYQTILESISGVLSDKEKKSDWLKTLNLEKSTI